MHPSTLAAAILAAATTACTVGTTGYVSAEPTRDDSPKGSDSLTIRAPDPTRKASGPVADLGADPTPGGGQGEPWSVNGCKLADFVDRTGASASRTVLYSFDTGPVLSPRCLAVSRGDIVHFVTGTPDCALEPFGGDAPSAIATPLEVEANGALRVAFDRPGFFGFRCAAHPVAMGAVEVLP